MPEGDSAYRVAANLDRALAGQVLTQFQIRTGALAAANLAGEAVAGAEAFGKHVFVRIGEWSLHSHMLMDGNWHIYRQGARWRRPGHQARIVLGTKHVQVVGFRVAQVKLVKTRDERRLVGHLGPDVLKPEWNEGGRQRAAENLGADPRPIHVALLDQRNVAGFGNEYANELCFLFGVDPATPSNQVDAEAILELGERLLLANRDRVARTTTGNTRARDRLHIYGRAGRPCPRCGTRVRFTRLGADASRGRHVYWCPRCQPPAL